MVSFDDCLIKGRGYEITREQIEISQEETKRRLQYMTKGLNIFYELQF